MAVLLLLLVVVVVVVVVVIVEVLLLLLVVVVVVVIIVILEVEEIVESAYEDYGIPFLMAARRGQTGCSDAVPRSATLQDVSSHRLNTVHCVSCDQTAV